jgi:cytochrome c2
MKLVRPSCSRPVRPALAAVLAFAAAAGVSAQGLPPASAADWAAQAATDRAAAKARLTEYAQVDAAAGVYQLPIDRAIELMVATPDLLAPTAAVDITGFTPLQRGEYVFNKLQPCSTCHSTDGTPRIGPSMKGAWGRIEKLMGGATVTVDEAYVRESVANPMAKIVDGFPPVMPPVALSEEDMAGLIAYLQSLK